MRLISYILSGKCLLLYGMVQHNSREDCKLYIYHCWVFKYFCFFFKKASTPYPPPVHKGGYRTGRIAYLRPKTPKHKIEKRAKSTLPETSLRYTYCTCGWMVCYRSPCCRRCWQIEFLCNRRIPDIQLAEIRGRFDKGFKYGALAAHEEHFVRKGRY